MGEINNTGKKVRDEGPKWGPSGASHCGFFHTSQTSEFQNKYRENVSMILDMGKMLTGGYLEK